MLTVVPLRGPRVNSQEEAALLMVATWYRRALRIESLVYACAVFHAGLAFTLFFAPADQLVTAGTAPALSVAPRYAWAILFLVAAVLLVMVTAERWRHLRLAAWMLVFPMGFAWLTSLLIATWSGQGSAVATWVWCFLTAGWAVVAVLHSLDRG